jgi:hypothetical protein
MVNKLGILASEIDRRYGQRLSGIQGYSMSKADETGTLLL